MVWYTLSKSNHQIFSQCSKYGNESLQKVCSVGFLPRLFKRFMNVSAQQNTRPTSVPLEKVQMFFIKIINSSPHANNQSTICTKHRNVWKLLPFMSVPEGHSEAIHHEQSTGVGCWSDKLAWILCQARSRFPLTEATVNLFIRGQVRRSSAGSAFCTESLGLWGLFNRLPGWQRRVYCMCREGHRVRLAGSLSLETSYALRCSTTSCSFIWPRLLGRLSDTQKRRIYLTCLCWEFSPMQQKRQKVLESTTVSSPPFTECVGALLDPILHIQLRSWPFSWMSFSQHNHLSSV